MYIPSKHFENPQQEIICPWTGEAYVHLEGDDLTLIDSKYHDGALDRLPRRFYQSPIVMPMGNGQAKIFMRQPHKD
jgi:hypothetical protein